MEIETMSKKKSLTQILAELDLSQFTTSIRRGALACGPQTSQTLDVQKTVKILQDEYLLFEVPQMGKWGVK